MYTETFSTVNKKVVSSVMTLLDLPPFTAYFLSLHQIFNNIGNT